MYPSTFGSQPLPSYTHPQEMCSYREVPFEHSIDDQRRYLENQYYLQKHSSIYQTLPSKKTQFFQHDANPERSVTPDITRGLDRNLINYNSSHAADPYRNIYGYEPNMLTQTLGIPVQVPNIQLLKRSQEVPLSKRFYSSNTAIPTQEYTHSSSNLPASSSCKSETKLSTDNNDSLRISPIDPRNFGCFQSSTPSSKNTHQDLKAAANLQSKMLSPKKSTMSNEELYAVIHKSKKKMNISTENLDRASPVNVVDNAKRNPTVKLPETGYIGDKSKSRLSWSPSKGEYVDFNADIDKLSPPNESKSRQSWACNDRKGVPQTSRLDFKKLLLQKSGMFGGPSRKLSAVEQLKLSREQVQPQKPLSSNSQQNLPILELSGSPRSLVNRKFMNIAQGGSPRNTPEKVKPVPKLLSPKSQWRFTNPRSDVLSSTILEDCREDESPSNSMEKKSSTKTLDNQIDINLISPINTTESTKKIKTLASIPESRSSVENKPQTMSIAQRLQAQRAQFFTSKPSKSTDNNNQQADNDKIVLPTLETAF